MENRRKVGTRPKLQEQSWDAPSGVPQTLHIEHTVRAQIADGTCPLKEQVPFVTDFSAEFGVFPFRRLQRPAAAEARRTAHLHTLFAALS
ncbi:hypothetical protein ACIF8T_38395 [Streptomyces sp. NPDC085946]|uniref:hypothetical protein n=1 Tax=Streptomyces sp. NPDC085946 TaxID=3365744 RepID=UPI0037D6DCF1